MFMYEKQLPVLNIYSYFCFLTDYMLELLKK